ncbi:tetratricopeptide (TPR) repeat protein [Kitasatospora gansuensis]|uniref:Tetratricopeptide (TPR) repeat protein n=1 Tax=Kitasatospora gansuensis TaxID=258050 RepID=A0A7W7SBH7_9ACTN|nr:tetratricopeptide repeat protein [Kitasatospora gansuensis]MBB4947403.1 tetratricopeptide (TPR) repeat protein [Kitasatospora gansuensis]
MDLYDRLRDLREHARAEREATGLRFSALATEQAVRLSTRPGAAEFTARRINDWAPANRKDARPPSFEDRGCLLALAELWSDWAELPFDEASWAALLPSPPAPLALPWTTNQINDGDFHGTVVMAQTANLGLPEQRRPAPSALAPLRALPPEFTGREAELAALLPLLDPASEAEPVLVTSVAGMGGIGKTTLALAAGHAALEQGWFTGALFIDLHGYDDTPVEATHALDTLLRALGVPLEQIPPDEEARASLYRSQLAAREAVLVIADNASDPEQLRSLVPGAGRHRLLTTSRDTLVALGATLVDLEVLTPTAAGALVERTLRTANRRPERVSSDPDGTALLTQLCGYLPLALQITTAQLVRDPHLTMARLAEDLLDDLASTGSRLDQLQDGRLAVRVSLDRSRRRLTIPETQLLEQLALAPGPDISTEAAAQLSGQKISHTRQRLTALANASLLRQSPVGGRWTMHDLVRDHSIEHARAAGRNHRPALVRLLRYYNDTTRAADAHLRLASARRPPALFPDRDAAILWLDTEQTNLIAGVQLADGLQLLTIARSLADALTTHLSLRRRYDDLHTTSRIELAAARALGNRAFEAEALLDCGRALKGLDRRDAAQADYQQALAINREIGNQRGMASSLSLLGVVLHEAGNVVAAHSAHLQAVAVVTALGSIDELAWVWGNHGLTLVSMGRCEEATAAMQRDLAACRTLGDRMGEAMNLNNLGSALRALSEFDRAAEAGQQAVQIFQALTEHYREGQALGELADTAQQAGLPASEVRSLRDAAVAAYRRAGAHQQAEKAVTGEDSRF